MRMITMKGRGWEGGRKMEIVQRQRSKKKEIENGGSMLEGWAVGAPECACA